MSFSIFYLFVHRITFLEKTGLVSELGEQRRTVVRIVTVIIVVITITGVNSMFTGRMRRRRGERDLSGESWLTLPCSSS
jgi:hypothetical protein